MLCVRPKNCSSQKAALFTMVEHASTGTQTAAVPLKILCLHDHGSNAQSLKQQLTVLGERLYERHSIDMVYVNAPLTCNISSSEIDHDAAPERTWWLRDGTTATTTTSSEPTSTYTGLDASLLMLQQIWASCPFWGIFAMGQGAAVASLFALSITIGVAPRVCVFVNGGSLLPEQQRLQDSMACLHLINNSKSTAQELLVQQFGGDCYPLEKTARSFPTFGDLNRIGRFFIQQKKTLCADADEGQIVALQTALHLAEVKAARVIAERIAANPPAALMAVIQPQVVAGWQGNKRRQPGEEGGGAPCPPEFLKTREQRTGKEPTA
jgi:hypothetical protein